MFWALIPGKGKLILGLVIALAIAGAVGYHYYKVNSLNSKLVTITRDLEVAIANTDKLEHAVETQKQSITILRNQRRIDQEKLNTLAVSYQESQKKVGDLRELLSRHDLGFLMLKKPGLLETRMNKATERVGKEFEQLTGGQND